MILGSYYMKSAGTFKSQVRKNKHYKSMIDITTVSKAI